MIALGGRLVSIGELLAMSDDDLLDLDRADGKTPGRLVYEADCLRCPTYGDGVTRPTWAQLTHAMRESWERNASFPASPAGGPDHARSAKHQHHAVKRGAE